MKFLFGVCCFGVSIVGTACAAEDVNEYRTALDTNYAEYRIVNVTDDAQRKRRQSTDSFDGDVLIGDFNFDGHRDFAAILSRKATESDLDHLSADQREIEKQVFLAVVCNGSSWQEGGPRYHCVQISEPGLGGFGSELDLFDWSDWSKVSDNPDAYGNMQCGLELQSRGSQKLLSLRQPFGRCDSFYFPKDDGSYGQCTYCAE